LVKARLERGRKRLHDRLERGGLTLAAALAAVEVSRGTASAALSAVSAATARAALGFAAGAPSPAGVSGKVIALAEGGLQAMSWSKFKMALAILVVVGVTGGGVGWLTGGKGNNQPVGVSLARTTFPGEKPATPPAKAGGEKRPDLFARAREELRRLAVQLEKEEAEISDMIVEARQKLVEVEERLREAQAEAQTARGASAEEADLKAEVVRIEASIARIRATVATREAAQKLLLPLEMQLTHAQDRLQEARKKLIMAGEAGTRRVVEFRRQIIRQEEDIRRLERKRDVLRQEAEHRREDAIDRIRRLEAGVVPEGDRQRALERKLDAVLRELVELRREVQRLRDSRKE